MLDDLAVKYNHSPLDYMLSILNNPMSSPERKMMAAEKAAPYVHAKLATTTTKLGSDGPIKSTSNGETKSKSIVIPYTPRPLQREVHNNLKDLMY